MLIKKHFKHNMIRKTVATFGSLFDNIYVVRWATDGSELSRDRVPFAYAPKQKWEQRNAQDPQAKEKFNRKSPRMSFEFAGLQYDRNRKLDPLQYISAPVPGKQTRNKQYTPVPYDMAFNLFIRAETTDDANQIVEQILPYFTPDYVVEINVIPELNLTAKIPFVLNSVEFTDSYMGTFEEGRDITWSISFTAKSFIFGPVSSSKKINNTITSLGLIGPDETLTKHETIHGYPTTVPPKPVDDILETDLWGYETIIVEATTPAKTIEEILNP